MQFPLIEKIPKKNRNLVKITANGISRLLRHLHGRHQYKIGDGGVVVVVVGSSSSTFCLFVIHGHGMNRRFGDSS
mgnify:CR=1 FL=1